jgi:V/A-type H+-transporting ATPase subunit A
MPGEPVVGSGAPMSATLGPGIRANIFDGIERPLKSLEAVTGAFIAEGASVTTLEEDRKWDVTLTIKSGDRVTGGQIFATCPETPVILHKSLIPPDVSGKVTWTAPDGQYNITEKIAVVKSADGTEHELKLAQKWPIKIPRPIAKRVAVSKPLITGQRIIDTIIPISKGGTAAIQSTINITGQ